MLVESANPAHSLADSAADARGAGRARAARRDRRRDDRDGPARRLRAAGADAVREVGGDVLQLRLPRATSSTCAARCSTRPTACCPSRRSTPAWSRRSARSTDEHARAAAGRRGARAGRRSPRRSSRPPRPTRRSARSRRSCSTARSGRRCPTARPSAAILWGAAHRCAQANPDGRPPRRLRRRGARAGRAALRRDPRQPVGRGLHRRRVRRDAGGGCAPPTAACTSPSPSCSTSWPRSRRDAAGDATPTARSCSSAGERRSFTANTIFRDPSWRKSDAERRAAGQPRRRRAARPRRRRSGPAHHEAGQRRGRGRGLRRRCSPVTSRCRTGSGSTIPAARAAVRDRRGARTSSPPARTATRSPGTPWHKHVPARLERDRLGSGP